MRITLLTLVAVCLSACTTLGQAPLNDLMPVFQNVGAYEGRTFVGDVYIIRTPARGVSAVRLTPDAETAIPLDSWSRRRLETIYGVQHGQRVRIRAVIREERIIVTQADAGNAACQIYQGAFYLTRVQVLRDGEP